jgi:4-amino-4-deoxy-L-arabinose transferase-like glycosyltransferase
MTKGWNLQAKVIAAILAAGFVLTVAVNWPGHLSYDSVLQLGQARSGVYNTWHPPVMAWLMGMGDALIPGTGLFTAFDAALAFGAVAAAAWLGRERAGWIAVGVAAVAVVLPQLLIYQGIVWKDVLFGDAAVAGFACFAIAANGTRRWSFAGAGFVLLVLAGLARQNGLVLLPFAAIAAGWIAAREGVTRGRAAAFGAGVFAGLLASVLAASALLNLRSDGEPGPTEQLRLLQIYDLAGAVAHDPGLALAGLDADDPEMAGAIRVQAPRLYTPVRNDPLISAPGMQKPLRALDEDALSADWRALVLHRPWLYLRVRSADFVQVLFTPDIAACRPIFTGIEAPENLLRGLGLAGRRDARDLFFDRYGKAFFRTPVLSHMPFLLIALSGIVLFLRRRRPEDIAFAAMLSGALAFTASFFAISIACDYRYLYMLDLSALVALLYACTDWRTLWRRSA